MHVITKPQASSITRLIAYIVLNVATGLIAAVLLIFLPQFDPFLIFIPAIVLTAWYGGFIVGLITTILSALNIAIMLLYPLNHPLITINTDLEIEALLLFLVGAFISYALHTAKKQDKIVEYQKKLRQARIMIETLENNYKTAKTEIKARDQFLAIASHELKTPVTSMLLQVQTAIHNIRNVSLANFSVATLLKMLESTEQQSKRLSKMVNDLLDLSLITTGKIELEVEETNISTLVEDVAEKFVSRLPDKNQLVLAIKANVKGYCDKVRLEQAVVNLISNAIKYGNNKPVTIQVDTTNTSAQIAISDQGIGIPVEQQKRIFNRFERAVSSRDYKGLGVGLYITYQIIKAHKGKIYLKSKPNNGSLFVLDFPLKQPKFS